MLSITKQCVFALRRVPSDGDDNFAPRLHNRQGHVPCYPVMRVRGRTRSIGLGKKSAKDVMRIFKRITVAVAVIAIAFGRGVGASRLHGRIRVRIRRLRLSWTRRTDGEVAGVRRTDRRANSLLEGLQVFDKSALVVIA